MKIFISIFRLYNIGGIESSVINLINEIKNDDNINITLCVLTNLINENVTIPKEINIEKGSNLLRDCYISRDYLRKQSTIQKIIRNIRRLKRRILGNNFIFKRAFKKIKDIESYDIAIAFINDKYNAKGGMISGGDYDFIIKKVRAKRKIAWIHANPYQEGLTYSLSKRIFAPFDAIVNVSKSCKGIFDEIIPEYEKKSFVVYNMYNIKLMMQLSGEINPYTNYESHLHFVTVSRLDNKTKRLDRVIKVCTKLRSEGYTNFDWTIVGDGPDKNKLFLSIEENNLSKTIIMTGSRSNPYPYMKYADLYVSTSIFESFGMSVREAQILECPVLITDVGPSNELVSNDINGVICGNSTKGVYEGIKRILNTPELLVQIKNSLSNNLFTNDIAKKQFYQVCNIH